MKKTLRRLAAALFALLPLGVLAQSQVRLELKDGSSSVYRLSEKPKASFADGKLTFGTATSSATYDMADVKKFYFEQEGTGVGRAAAENGREVTFTYTDGRHVTISGVEAARVRVFSLNGKRANPCMSATGGAVRIDLGGLPAGAYLIQASEKQSIKITKK